MVAVKKLIPEVAGARIDDALMEKVSQRIAEIRITPEAQEGLSAFLEKRKTAWSTPASEKSKAANRQATKKKGKN
jgi:methylglutaconyl-CoA hydratase